MCILRLLYLIHTLKSSYLMATEFYKRWWSMFGIQMTFYRPLVRHPLTGVPLHLYYLFTVLHLQTLQHWCLTPPLLIFSSGFIDKILKVSTSLGKQAFEYGLSTWNWDACPEISILAQAVLRIFAKSPDSRWSDSFKHVLDSYARIH